VTRIEPEPPISADLAEQTQETPAPCAELDDIAIASPIEGNQALTEIALEGLERR